MKTEIYATDQKGQQPCVIVRDKRYLFLASSDDEMVEGYDGIVFPYLCTYLFADNHRQLIATVMPHYSKEPELMNVDWSGKNKLPIIRPEFTRKHRLGVPSELHMPDVALILLKSCRQSHQLWSSSFAGKQLFFDSIRRSITLFNKTYYITKDRNIPKDMDGIVYHDPIEGFIFIEGANKPAFALTQYANESYFCSVADVNGRVVSMFALEDADIGKLGGELLYDSHRSQIANRLFSILTGELGVVA